MFNYKETLEAMRRERASLQAEMDKLDQAIAALQVLAGTTALAEPSRGAPRTRRKLGRPSGRYLAKVSKISSTLKISGGRR